MVVSCVRNSVRKPDAYRARQTFCAAVSLAALAAWAAPAHAQSGSPPNLVSACSGVSLPRSAVTDIVTPVINGVVAPIEDAVNPVLGVLGALLPFVPPLNIDTTTLLNNAASGAPITLQVFNTSGTLVGPTDACDSQADSFTLRTPQGIAIGGNRITGLGNTGLEALAGSLDAIAFGNSARTNATALGAIAIGTNADVGAGAIGSIAIGSGALTSGANSVALGAGSIAARGPVGGYVAPGLTAAQTSVGEVSVGAPGAERQITNVAAGSSPNDAVNVAQLNGIAGQIDALGNIAVQHDALDRSTVTFGGASGTTLTNVRAGTIAPGSTDAINGAQLNATNANVTANTTSITNLSGIVNTNTVDIADLDTELAGYALDLSNLTTVVAGNSADIAGNTGAINALNTDVASNTAGIAANTSDIAGLNTMVAGHTSDIATLNSTVADNTTDIADNANAITALSTTVAGNTADIVSLGATVAGHTTDIASNANAIIALSTTVAGNSADIATINVAVAGNTADIAGLTTVVTGNTSDIANLTTTVTGNTTAIVNLGTTVAGITSDITNLNTAVSGNTTDIANLGTTVASNMTAIVNLGAAVAGNTTDISNLSTSVSANTTAITNLDMRVAGNTTSISVLNGAVTANTVSITKLGDDIGNGAIGTVQYSDPANPSVPNGGIPTNDLTLVGAATGAVALHNVANGIVAAGSNDAVNGGQLHALSLTNANRLTYDLDFFGDRANSVTLAGGNAAAPVAINNLAGATLAAGSTGAVNGGQLFATNQALAFAQTTADSALTLGQNAVQYDAGRSGVTLNPGGAALALHNVAAGVLDNDAVNVAQLNSGLNAALGQANLYTDSRIAALNFDLQSLRRESFAGTAGALAAAGLPQAYEAGKGMIALGGGTYMGSSAIAFGFSKAFNDGRTVAKLGASYDSRGRAGASGGVGYQF